jgi:hypothetical protein
MGGPNIILLRLSMGLEGIIINTAINSFLYGAVAEIDPEIFLREIIENKEKAFILYLAVVLIDEELDMPILGEDSATEMDQDLPEELYGCEAVFDEQAVKAPPVLKEAKYTIDLEEGRKPPYGPLYPLN